MELAEINKLLESYFEGNTSLQEEGQLNEFFNSNEVPEHLEVYRPMFQSFSEAREERSTREFTLPVAQSKSTFMVWSIAASIALVMGVGSLFFFQNNGLTAEQEEALVAYNQAKETMLLLSENLNKGTSKITYLKEFEEGTSTINLINQFTETKNRILK